MAEELRQAPSRTSTSPAGTSRPRSTSIATASRRLARPSRGARRARRRARARLGRRAAARCSGPRGETCAGCGTGSPRARGSQVALDARERPMHCHHEKTIVIDDRVAFVGGIDLTSEAGDRFDYLHHPRAPQSAGTTSRPASKGRPSQTSPSTSPALARESPETASGPAVPVGPAGDVELQIVRTVPERIYNAMPNGDFGDPRVLRRARSAAPSGSSTSRTSSSGRPRSPRSSPRRSSHPPTARLPAPRAAAGEAEHAAPTTRAGCSASSSKPTPNAGGSSPRRSLPGPGRAPTRSTSTRRSAIVDDDWLTIGSANLNEHSLFNDTEMNVVTHDRLSRARRGSGSGRSISSWGRPNRRRPDRGDRDASGSRSAESSSKRRNDGLPAEPPPRLPTPRLETNEPAPWPRFRPSRRRVAAP